MINGIIIEIDCIENKAIIIIIIIIGFIWYWTSIYIIMLDIIYARSKDTFR